MWKQGLRKRWPLMAVAAVALALFLSCAQRRLPESSRDTPAYHLGNGMRLLGQGLLDEAQGEFTLALALDPKYGPAHVGMGLVFAGKYASSRDAKEKSRLFRQAFASLKMGKRFARGRRQKVAAYVGYIRAHTMVREKGWLEMAKECFDYAIALDSRAAAAYYYLGEAYEEAYQFDRAAEMYQRALKLGNQYAGPAGRALEVLEKIQKAAPESPLGKKIALSGAVSRSEIAALFVEELKLQGICRPTRQPGAATEMKRSPVTDIGHHPLRLDIETVIQLGLRGLEPYPDHTFRPDEKINRAAFAMMLADILLRATGRSRVARTSGGSASRYADLRRDQPYFEAVMICSSWGILKAADVAGGLFRPMAPVSGVEALLAIHRLEEQLSPVKAE